MQEQKIEKEEPSIWIMEKQFNAHMETIVQFLQFLPGAWV